MHRVVVIGAGLAGMVAAIEAAGAGADVLLVDRGSVGIGTNSAMANGVFAGPTVSHGEAEYVADTMRIGREINKKTMVEAAARGMASGMKLLRSTGLDIAEGAGTYSVRSPDPSVIPGITLVRKVAEAVRNLAGVGIVSGFYITELIREHGCVCGIRGFDRRGEETTVPAGAVILATGGAGAVYLKNDNQKTIMGQGYRLAAMAGLDLWDMEFVQYFPLVLAEPRLPSMIIFPPYNDAIELKNSAGEDIIRKHGLGNINEASVKKRDQFSAILFRELQSGPVLMDFRKVPAGMWEKHPLSLLARLKYDFTARPVTVSPATHFFMGGVRTTEKAETDVPGLFACGEVVAGLHGANRRGGNALTECIVFGAAAGRNAARFAFESKGRPGTKPRGAPASALSQGSGGDAAGDLRTIRRRIRETAWRKAGVVRTAEEMTEGLAEICQVRRMLDAVQPRKDQELRLRLDLESAAFTVQAILTASLGRKESRGSFLREDFPGEDKDRWKKNSCLKYEKGSGTFTLTFGTV